MTQQSEGPVTIYKVAKVAGVSPSTVSRTFSRPGRVNAETAERVRQAAKTLGYRVKQVRQGASARVSSKLLGVLVPDISNPFYTDLIRGTQEAANDLGYEIVLANSRESAIHERAALERLIPVVDGFLVCSSRLSDSTLRTVAKQRPLVSVNRALVDVPSVISDNPGGAREALELLHRLGHQGVVYVSGPEASWEDGVRFRALRCNSDRLGMVLRRIGPVPPTFEGGLSVAPWLALHRATAAIGFNDLVAVGLMHALVRSGFRVPDQMSVVGFDGILTARLALPPLTTVAAPLREMGANSIIKLVDIVNGARPQTSLPLIMPVHLRVRGSTAPRMGRGAPFARHNPITIGVTAQIVPRNGRPHTE